MTHQDANRVRAWLKSRWHVVVPDDWLVACLEWIHTEDQGSVSNPSSVNQMVYDQWMLSDLHDLGSQCLPENLVQQQKVLLNGSFCLQIDSVVDVSTPFYAQLQKVKGTENANVHVSATQQSQQTWEPKAGRMLMMNLTDGIQDIQGMEYRPIPCLNTQITPGSKVLVHGEVLCRLGVLMLTASNISLLGGEVDTLVESNTQEALLRRKLEQNSQQNQGRPQVERREFPPANGRNATAGHQRASAASVDNQQRAPAALAAAPQAAYEWDDEDELIAAIDTAELAATEKWEDDDRAFEDLMDQIDESVLSSHQEFQHQQQHANRQEPPAKLTNRPAVTSSHQPNKARASVRHDSVLNGHKPTVKPDITTSRVRTEHVEPVSHGDIASSLRPPVLTLRQPVGNTFNTNQANHMTSSNVAGQKRLGSKLTLSSSNRSDGSLRNNAKRIRMEGNDDKKEDSKEMALRNPMVPPTGCAITPQEVYADRNMVKVSPCQGSKDKTMVPEKKSPLQEIGLDTPPFTYLVRVQAAWPPREVQTVQIKAYVATLLDTLKHNDGSHWALPVKINDGTASHDVDLSDQMLTSLIGFTAQECMSLRAAAKLDKQARARLTGGIKQCQDRLIQMAAILEVKLDPGCQRPVVLSSRPATADDWHALRRRNATL